MDLESIWYELSPYVYTFSGVTAITAADVSVGQWSGALLLGAALTIIRLRWVSRRKS